MVSMSCDPVKQRLSAKYIGAGRRTALTPLVVRDPRQAGGIASNHLHCWNTADLEREEVVWWDARASPTRQRLDDDLE